MKIRFVALANLLIFASVTMYARAEDPTGGRPVSEDAFGECNKLLYYITSHILIKDGDTPVSGKETLLIRPLSAQSAEKHFFVQSSKVAEKCGARARIIGASYTIEEGFGNIPKFNGILVEPASDDKTYYRVIVKMPSSSPPGGGIVVPPQSNVTLRVAVHLVVQPF